jgi:hypothetical protein
LLSTKMLKLWLKRICILIFSRKYEISSIWRNFTKFVIAKIITYPFSFSRKCGQKYYTFSLSNAA